MIRQVAVEGGELSVEWLDGDTPPVLAIHGISSHRRLWNWMRAVDPGITVVAPDLRGRGDSVRVGPPRGIRQHATDMIAVLDGFDLERVVVCGMSMGGFVAVELAALAPDRVASLVLVDGGLPMQPPPDVTPGAVKALFADRIARLGREWESVEEFAEFFTSTTAPLLDPTDPLLLDYLSHDLRHGVVRLDPDALVTDATDVFFAPPALEPLETQARLLCAEWSVGRGTMPAYTPERVEPFRGQLQDVRFVEGVDHAASIMSLTGGGETAALIRAALG